MTTADVLALRDLLPDGRVFDDVDVLEAHRRDRAGFCPAGAPAALVRARSTEDVSVTLEWAHRNRVPVVPQGARSGLSGAANALDGCILLSLEKMDRILDIDVSEQVAVVQPGVVNGVLAAKVAEHGLFYPPDPGSRSISTIGGNVATNAGGMCCVKYGVTGDFVRGLEVVLADGRVMRTGRRTAKGVAGYDLTHLIVGSEGTLGVVTEVTVALRPAAAQPLTAVAFFPTIADAVRTVAGYLAEGYRPSVLEFMDRPTVNAVQKIADLGFPEGMAGMLLVQSDRGDAAPGDLAAFETVARTNSASDVVVADDPAEGELLMQARRLVGDAHEHLGLTVLVDDVCVPRRNMVNLVEGLGRIAEQYQVQVLCAGHAGDGNMHPVVAFDADDAAESVRAQQAFDAIMALGLDLGGTITGEHGVGHLKQRWLGEELDEAALSTQRAIKAALDPHNILNPGRVLPE
ncbi:glycolate oxidase [Saccharopolyspora antimicrobica]|uniref:Glycolate oxidase n=1 Tax=Saccharopolyspora antimicrobica TaxID=455193 RepID=A0A1I4SIL0_9PSEU|nr:FAD-linked oxidase C-terminal domain-containing protein [Saccharopolyspora antimicrobica]RKT87760.1 glycolate oxidase [Saccharopolyspora antimicrobica]SFM64295.1 glycolate oxidase [Saccharopolyspora antimicrobica]